MNEITVDPQEVVVWLAFSDGLRKQIITQSARQKKEHESKFGKIPEVVPFSIDKRLEEAE